MTDVTDGGRGLEATEVDLLLLQVGGKPLAVGAAVVAEILDAAQATPLPEAPPYLEGVLKVRDVVAPLIDLRLRLLAERIEPSQVLLLRRRGTTGARPMAMRVDRVVEILHLRLGEIEPAPPAGASQRYLLGVVRSGESLVPLMDLEEVLTSEEMVSLEAILSALEAAAAPAAAPAAPAPAPPETAPARATAERRGRPARGSAARPRKGPEESA